MSQPGAAREPLIDALRGLSAAAVVLYHYRPLDARVLSWGMYGVCLFFMISGYCMVESLRNSASLPVFLSKRFSRLFPAMVVCGLLTTLIEKITKARLDRLHGWSDYFLTCVNLPALDAPLFIGRLWGGRSAYAYPDGAYWTLAVEFMFYALVGAAFFLFPRGRRLSEKFSLLVVFMAGALAAGWTGVGDVAPYMPAFLCGVAVRQWHGGDRRGAAAGFAGAAAALAALRRAGTTPESMPVVTNAALGAFAVSLALLFLASAWRHWRAPEGLFRFPVFLGAVSYPLYLLHQDIGYVFMAIVGDGWFSRLLLTPAIVLLLAVLVHRTVEFRFQRSLQGLCLAPLWRRKVVDGVQGGCPGPTLKEASL